MTSLLVDSHCHIDFPELAGDISGVRAAMDAHGVGWALCAGVTLERLPAMLQLLQPHANFFASVGVHPDSDEPAREAGEEELLALADNPKVVAIGETGLDYYRLKGDLEWQRRRFRTHIRAARACAKPLIIHMREASEDCLRILREEDAGEVGGVFHCFTADVAVAREALDLGFYISLSGIVTFKKAQSLREVAKMVPNDRLLLETDSPWLAPTPHRGKTNQPAWVRYVAETTAELRGVDIDELAAMTSNNFFRLFKQASR